MRLSRACGFLAAVLSLTGCAGVEYQQVYKDGQPLKDAASPPSGAFAFSLHTSNVTLTAPASSAAKPGVPIPCTDKNSKPLATPVCLAGVTEAAAPASDRTAAYFVEPLNISPLFGGTQLAPHVDANDVLLLSAVTFSYNNKAPGILTATGTGAAAGFVFGPWGAVIGGAIGLASGIAPQLVPELGDLHPPRELVCQDDIDLAAYDQAASAGVKAPVQITLPVALHYESVSSTDNGCWYAFPVPVGTVGAASQNLGWFYRMVPQDKAAAVAQITPPVLFKDDLATVNAVTAATPPNLDRLPFEPTNYFFSAPNQKPAEHSFPVSACIAVNVQVIWWNDIGNKDSGLIASTALNVADPNIVQVVHWSSGGSITMLPCGAYASTGSPSTALMDDVSSLVKQTQAIQAAQQQWKKLNPTPKP